LECKYWIIGYWILKKCFTLITILKREFDEKIAVVSKVGLIGAFYQPIGAMMIYKTGE